MTGEEAKLLLKAARGDRLYALYAVALALGLRRGEALGLRWEDVNLGEGVIFVRQTLQRLGGKLVFGPVKSDESERVIGLPAPCLAALRQHRNSQQAEQRIAGKDRKDHGLVFATGIGTPIEPRNLNRHFVRLLERVGLRRVRTHDLRHSCATLLYERACRSRRSKTCSGTAPPPSPN